MPESTTPLETDSGAYHQIHFAWADPTLLGRVGPGPASTSLPQRDQPVLRSWRDRLLTALTADYRSALPDTDPADYPETLWAHHYPDGQSALVYRWPGDVRDAHAWAIVGPSRGLTLPRILALHENPNTRPAARRPPAPGWAAMRALPAPEPWERTAAPGAVRTRDRRAAETQIDNEPILVGAVARALEHPDRPIHIVLDPDRADLWQAVQLRFLWGLHRTLYDVLTPRTSVAAAGWKWSFSTYDPVLGVEEGPHLAFGPPTEHTPAGSPFLDRTPTDHLKVADGLVTVLREEGGDALADHLRDRGVPEAVTFVDRRDLLCDWFDPSPRPSTAQSPWAEEPGEEALAEGEPSAEAEPAEEGPAEEDIPEPEELPSVRTPAAGLLGQVPLLQEPPLPRPSARRPPEEEGFEARAASAPASPEPDPEPEPERSAHRALFDPPEPAEPAEPLEPPEPPESPEPPEPPETFSSTEPPAPPEPPEPLDPPRTNHPKARTPADAPPLPVITAAEEAEDEEETDAEGPPDYAAETVPGADEASDDPDDNWPTQYVDLPLSRLERWHARRGPEGAYTDVIDARAAVRAERAELQRVREERDHYHAEVQELRREIARLDQSWIDTEPGYDTPNRSRRWPLVLLVLVLIAGALVLGLEIGSRTGRDTLDILGAVWSGLTGGWWPL
ncbi:hypothetical protein [Nocardiopsis oceani]